MSCHSAYVCTRMQCLLRGMRSPPSDNQPMRRCACIYCASFACVLARIASIYYLLAIAQIQQTYTDNKMYNLPHDCILCNHISIIFVLLSNYIYIRYAHCFQNSNANRILLVFCFVFWCQRCQCVCVRMCSGFLFSQMFNYLFIYLWIIN